MSLVERFVIGVDIQRFSSRVVRAQMLLQRELNRILDAAAEEAGISRSRWICRAEGDGEVAALPADVDLLAAVRKFVTELDTRLADHNEDHSPKTRIRLRVAMHMDTLIEGDLGYAGAAFVVLRRLLDSTPVRDALRRDPEVNLAQIISASLFEKVVVPELGGLRPRQFQEVLVDLPAKDFRQTAYLYVPGAHAGRLSHPRVAAAPRLTPAAQPGFPWPVPKVAAGTPGRRPPPGPPKSSVHQPPESPPPSVVVNPAARAHLEELAKSLEAGHVERADTLTTAALLAAVERADRGWLRAADGPRLPAELLTEVDRLWARFSGDAWGFRAQRARLARRGLSGAADFLKISLAFGWRRSEEEMIPRYAEFIARADRGAAFFPTLRNPEREHFPEWHDEWSATVRSVHAGLRSQE
ncbi:MAG TPA: GUN4 domain-containing protein [Streptosporangiaceae bacterium]|nr:GUN4 domain-containing protein [Streptosporangiaceae bacterium]